MAKGVHVREAHETVPCFVFMALLLACLECLIAPHTALADDVVQVASWAELASALTSGASDIQLTADVTFQDGDTYLTVKGSNTVTVDLNGHTIDRGLAGTTPTTTSDSVIRVEGGGRHDGGHLILTNTANGTGTITGGSSQYGGGVWVYNNGTLEVGTGVAISGNTAEYGGGIYITLGTATLHDGAVVENNSANYGGGVCVRYVAQGFQAPDDVLLDNDLVDDDEGASPSMPTCTVEKGAAVRANVATTVFDEETGGAGVYLQSGQLVLDGGTIDSNEDQGSGRGGGVFMWSGVLTINSGSISNNKLTRENLNSKTGGGGVYVHDGKMTMNGGAIEGNETFPGKSPDPSADYSGRSDQMVWLGGGVYLGGGTFELNDGSITGNFAGDAGGGVCQIPTTQSCVFTMHGGSIDNNVCGSDATGYGEGGGLCQDVFDPAFLGHGFATIDGGSISNNYAHTGAGGIVTVFCELNLGGTAIVEGNTTDGFGGGIYYMDDIYEIFSEEVTTMFTMTGSIKIANNTDAYGASNLYFTLGMTSVDVELDADADVRILPYAVQAETASEGESGDSPYRAVLWDAKGNTDLSNLSVDRDGYKLVVSTDDQYAGHVMVVRSDWQSSTDEVGEECELEQPAVEKTEPKAPVETNPEAEAQPKTIQIPTEATEAPKNTVPATGDASGNVVALAITAFACLAFAVPSVRASFLDSWCSLPLDSSMRRRLRRTICPNHPNPK